MKVWVEKLKQWLRQWLGITKISIDADDALRLALSAIAKADKLQELDQLKEKIKTIEIGQNGLEIKDAKLEALIGDTAQGLQQQISELASLGSAVTSGKPPQSEEVQIQPGHVPWSQRKRNYEASKRVPLGTPTTQQIKENTRIIASGTRKSDKDA